jgi:hypothetical protein
MPLVILSEEERELVRDFEWQRLAPPEVLRRRVNVQKRIRDFPEPDRVLPTRLGNILRRHEDMTNETSVETFVQRVFDDLSPSLQTEHDEQRTRLALYCSMVFVVAFVATVAAARVASQHGAYSLGSLVVGAVLMQLMYRAALASARAYGGLLVVIGGLVHQPPGSAPST